MEVLQPVYDARKSFYKKAHVKTTGNIKTLYSYKTPILDFDMRYNEITKIYWNGYSATTMRHINEFLQQNNYNKLNKKTWEDMVEFLY